MEKTIRTIIPIRGPECEEIYDNYDKLLSEISSFGKNKNFVSLLDENEDQYKKIVDIDFEIIISSKYDNKEDKKIKTISEKFNFFHTEWIREFLSIKFCFKRSIDGYEEIYINSIIKRLSLIIHLSYNVKLDLLNGVIFDLNENDKYVGKTELLISDIDMVYSHSFEINWPFINQPTFLKTIEWFTNNKLHTEGISKTKAQRAINAISYSFSNLKEKDTSELFWTMIGIEALLADGANNIINQIKTKSSLILGQPSEFKKKLDKLYNYRSRFVHGDIDFPAKFSSEYEVFEREYWDYSKFALSILLALTKELIITNKQEFIFEYKLIQ